MKNLIEIDYERNVEKLVTSTSTVDSKCEHHDGWYHTVKFGWFKKRFLACNDCGELIPKSNWSIFL